MNCHIEAVPRKEGPFLSLPLNDNHWITWLPSEQDHQLSCSLIEGEIASIVLPIGNLKTHLGGDIFIHLISGLLISQQVCIY